jgi:hypothetical protein
MIKTANIPRECSTARGGEQEIGAGSSVRPDRRVDRDRIKLNPDAIAPARRERPGTQEDPERWDGLS